MSNRMKYLFFILGISHFCFASSCVPQEKPIAKGPDDLLTGLYPFEDSRNGTVDRFDFEMRLAKTDVPSVDKDKDEVEMSERGKLDAHYVHYLVADRGDAKPKKLVWRFYAAYRKDEPLGKNKKEFLGNPCYDVAFNVCRGTGFVVFCSSAGLHATLYLYEFDPYTAVADLPFQFEGADRKKWFDQPEYFAKIDLLPRRKRELPQASLIIDHVKMISDNDDLLILCDRRSQDASPIFVRYNVITKKMSYIGFDGD